MDRPDTPDDRERPPSVREAMGGGGGSSTSDDTDPDGEAGDAGAGESKEGEQEVQRPTPVREMMAPEAGPAAADFEPPSRTFQHEGQEWVVILAGQTETGLPSDPGAPLMHLHFARAEDPGRPQRELLCVGRDLEHLYDEELRQYLERARPRSEE